MTANNVLAPYGSGWRFVSVMNNDLIRRLSSVEPASAPILCMVLSGLGNAASAPLPELTVDIMPRKVCISLCIDAISALSTSTS
eukprot:CAMPEP_0194496966 /NCGR_PEP_ID=MMETSP0253-20130528/14065_1 /TAXON_ID=2966 /ORGANISM="Noctiluca scintillans" /LENGTH=83 /DNA_ID=CAMNT_0039338427 /DNA_START=948 /DNA_END=1199 /DNA_ORIENTATION=-